MMTMMIMSTQVLLLLFQNLSGLPFVQQNHTVIFFKSVYKFLTYLANDLTQTNMNNFEH